MSEHNLSDNVPGADAEYSTAAFYGVDASTVQVRRLFDSVESWFASLKHPASTLAVYRHGVDDESAKVFARRKAKLLRDGFDDVRGFAIDSDGVPGSYCVWDVGFLWTDDPTCIVIAARTSIIDVCDTEFLTICREIVNLAAPTYGIGYRCAFKRGPTGYAIGLAFVDHDTLDLREATLISHWGRRGVPSRCFDNGVIRGVFPLNFLNSSQVAALEQVLDDVVVEPFGNGLVLWRPDPSEIADITLQLVGHSILFEDGAV